MKNPKPKQMELCGKDGKERTIKAGSMVQVTQHPRIEDGRYKVAQLGSVIIKINVGQAIVPVPYWFCK